MQSMCGFLCGKKRRAAFQTLDVGYLIGIISLVAALLYRHGCCLELVVILDKPSDLIVLLRWSILLLLMVM